MHDWTTAALAAAAAAFGAAATIAAQPIPTIGFLLQGAAAGTLVGTLIAYRRRRENPRFDTFPVITRWSALGLILGVLYVAGDAVL
jgi:hypothetical protein